MKLAEALIERKALKDRIKNLEERLDRVAKVQEGDRPTEDPTALLQQLREALAAMEEMVTKINRTNIAARLGEQTIMEAIARRDRLATEQQVLRRLAQLATPTRDPFARNEIRFVPTVDAAAVQRDADEMTRILRDLHKEIQAANWAIELTE
ncbi:MAG TPA: DIP1984 family protein [Nitrospiraceae bacterium]|nr:DIP1984 family protein [Nitrospiraceae bacterium]